MANYERRNNPDWSDENNFRNRSRYDRDYEDQEFYRQYRGSNFNPEYDNEQFGARRGSMSNPNYNYQPDYGSSRNQDYGRDRDWNYENRGYEDRGFRAGGNSDYYGRNMGSSSNRDYDRDYGNQGRNQGSWGGSDYERNTGNQGRNSDYERSFGYEGSGYGSNYQGQRSGSWGGSDYDRNYGYEGGQSGFGSGSNAQGRNMGSGRQSYSQGRDWTNNQGQNWGGGQGNFQSGQQGEHYGRGPQDYKRSDDRIKEDVNDRLTWHGNVDATHIQVSVKSGEVTLDGTVTDRYQKRVAEDIAEQVHGVSDVQNHLKVQTDTSQSSKRSSSSSSSSQKNEQSGMGQVPNGKPKERANS